MKRTKKKKEDSIKIEIIKRGNIKYSGGVMSQLEEYLEKINHLPIDVNRQLRLIKELDLRIQEDSRKLQELQEEYLAQLRQAKDKKTEFKRLEDKRRNIEILQR